MTDSKKPTPKTVTNLKKGIDTSLSDLTRSDLISEKSSPQTSSRQVSATQKNKKKFPFSPELEHELNPSEVEYAGAPSDQVDNPHLYSSTEPHAYLVAQAGEAVLASTTTGVGAGVAGVGLAGSAAGVTGSLGMAGVATSALLATTGGVAAGAAAAGTVALYSYLTGDEKPPTIMASQSFSYPENRLAGTPIGTVAASDNVGVTGFRFTATGTANSADGYYTINANGLVILTQAGAEALAASNDFETGANSFIYGIQASDAAGNWSASTDVTFNLTDVYEAPNILSVEPMQLSAFFSPPQGQTVSVEFTLQRAGDRNDAPAATVDWVLEGLSAADFPGGLLPSGTVAFAQGSHVATVIVQVPASFSFEALREATLRLENPSAGYAIDPDNAQAMVRIVDDANVMGGGLVFTISADKSTTLLEGAAGRNTVITYTVTRTGDTSEALELGYVLGATGSALLTGNDFANGQGAPLSALPAGRMLFAVGAATATFTVTVRGDDAVGPDEAFDISLTDLPQGARVIGNTSGAILNDDAYISVTSQAIADAGHGEVTHTFLIKRTGTLSGSHTVTYLIEGVGEQSTDLFDRTGQISFADGEDEQVISFTVPAGQTTAGHKTFAMQLQSVAGGNYTLLNDRATSSINPNLQDVELSATVDRVLEGIDAAFSYTVTRSGVVDGPLTLRWAVETTSENGVSAADFEGGLLPRGEITFAPNQTTATITFKTAQDLHLEGAEGFRLQLVSENLPAGVRLVTPQIEGFIADDESALGFRQNAVFAAVEGDTGPSEVLVTVSRVGFTGNASTAEWRISPSTAILADLMPGQDLLGDNGGYPSGTLTLLPGQATADITIRIAGDSHYEGGLNESFAVTLSNASAGTKIIGSEGTLWTGYANTVQATIVNDDALIGLQSSRVNVVEGNGGNNQFAEIVVTRTGSTVGGDTVKWSLSSIQSGVSADNTDLGIENTAVGVFNQLENSWINLAHLNGSQSAQGTVQVTKSGYILVAYNRDKRFDDYDDGNPVFDQYLLKSLSVSEGASLFATGPLADHDFIASNTSLSAYGQSLFQAAGGLSLPGQEGEGQHVVISSPENLGGVYFKVSGLGVDGQPVSEVIKGSNAGASATAALFTQVTRVESLAPGFAVGELEVPTDDYDYNETEYFQKLKVTWTDGDAIGILEATANDYRISSGVSGAEFRNDTTYPVLRSEADLSDATFVIKGGLFVAAFGSVAPGEGDFNFEKGDGIYGQGETLRFDVPQFIRAEQVSGMFQSADGSAAPNRFMVTGINQDGQKVSEVIEVEDFDADGITAVNTYTSGNLLAQSVILSGGTRLMISTNGESVPHTVVLDEAFLLENFGFSSMDQVNQISLRNIYSGSVERFDGSDWTSIGSWNGIDKSDLTAGHIRAAGSLAGASFELSVSDENWNEQVQTLAPIPVTEFTVSGHDAQGRAITETIAAPDFNYGVSEWGRDGDKATIATKKAFESIDSVMANQAFSGNVQLGLSKPVSTTNAFIELYGVAAVDEQGEYIDPNSGAFSGKIEFTVPLEVTLQGPKSGVVISSQVMNYIQSIEIQRQLPEDIRINIGYQAPDFDAPIPGSDGFLVLQNGDNALTAEINNNPTFNTDVRGETGNVNPDRNPNQGYAIFKVDAPAATVENPVTISFDVAQLGRYGFDVGRIAYAPDGTFSTHVDDLIGDGQNLLVPVVEASGPETTESQGVVALPGSGFIWVRYANLSDSNEGSDQATIRSLYVDQGARLSIVGQKAIADGVANIQSVDGNTELLLNGVSVSYAMPDHSHLDGDVLVYVRQPDIERFDGLYFDYVGKNSEGATVTQRQSMSSFYGSEKPNDGMVRFKSLASLGIEELERFTWDEETSSSQMWEPIFGVVKGSLNHLADDQPVPISTQDLFDISYYDADESYPGVPVNVSYEVAGQWLEKKVPVEQVLPEFARSILYSQEIAAESQSLDLAITYESAKRLTLTSTQDLSGRQITITGTGAQGEPLVEVVSGPNASTIVTIAKFLTVTEVSVEAGDLSGQLSMGNALAFTSPTALSAYASDDMPNAIFTALGLDANGQVVRVELDGVETYVTHPLGVFSELWSLTNNGLATEGLTVKMANPPKTLLDLDQFGASAFNSIATNQDIGQDETAFAQHVSGYDFGLASGARLVFECSPALAGRTVQFYGYSPQGDGGSATYEYLIPESGVLVTPMAFEYAYDFKVLGGDGSGQINVSFAQTLTPNSDLILKAASDFSGDLVLNGFDSNGDPVSVSFDALEANAARTVTGLSVLTSYSYSGAGTAPELSLTSIPRYGFYQSIPLSGQLDEQGYIVLGADKHVVITVEGSDAEQQIFNVTGLVDGELVTETLYGIADNGISAITQNQFTHLLKVEVGSSNSSSREQLFSIGTVSPILAEQAISRYGADMKLGEAVAVFESVSKVSLSSADDLSASSFLVTGRDAAGQEITETIMGPNASTVLSTKAFSQVSSIKALGDATGQVKVGYVTQAGAMVDGFIVSGDGTEANPLIGHSTNTLESYLDSNQNADGIYSESDVLLYVDTRGAQGPVMLHYDLAVQGSAGADSLADRLYVEFSATEIPLLSGEVTFAPGASEATILVPIAGDDPRELDESLRLRLDATSVGASLDEAKRSSELVILNDDDLVNLVSAPQSGSEGNNTQAAETLRFQVNRLIDRDTLEVHWHISGLSSDADPVEGAAESDDFVATSGVVTFAAGALSAMIEVQLAADRLFEGNESFSLVLSPPTAGSGFGLGATSSVSGTILEDDVGLRIDATGATSQETDDRATHTFTVVRLGDVRQASSLVWSVTPTSTSTNTDALLVDFGGAFPTQQTLAFAADEASKTITVTTHGDDEMTGDRNFTLTVSNGVGDSTDVRSAAATGTIVEDDPVDLAISSLQIRQTEATTSLGYKEFTYTLTREDASRAANYAWTVLPGDDVSNTVASGADFETGQDVLGSNDGLPSGRLAFVAGEPAKTIKIRVLNDAVIEGDEAFKLHFVGTDASEASHQDITAYIVNDTGGYGIDVAYAGSLQGDAFFEGSDGTRQLHLTFFRAGGSDFEETLAFSMSGGADTALSLADFESLSAFPENEPIVFAPGQSAVTRTYVVRADSVLEQNETLSVVLNAEGGGATLANRSLTLRNDDSVVNLQAMSDSLNEGTHAAGAADEDLYATLTYRVDRTGALDQDSTVQWRVKAQGGIDANDFVTTSGGLPSGTVTFAANETVSYKEFSIRVRKDATDEGTGEDLIVELYNPSAGSLVGTATALTRVVDDDETDSGSGGGGSGGGGGGTAFDPPVWSVSALTTRQTESNADTTYTFTIQRPSDADPGYTSIKYRIGADPGAVEGYSAASADIVGGFGEQTLVFAQGEFTKNVTVLVRGDQLPEQHESFAVTLVSATRGSLDQNQKSLTLTIGNDDSNFSVAAGAPVLEGDARGQAFVISRDYATDQDQTIHWSVSGSGANPALDIDFTGPLSGTVTFDGPELTKTVYVPFESDADIELDETFTFAIALGDGTLDGAIVQGAAIGTILGDDSMLSVGFESGQDLVREGSGTDVQFVEFLITRNFNTAGSASVNWTLSGDAVVDGLLLETSGHVDFADGVSVQRVRVAVTPNEVISGDKTFQVELTDVVGSGLLSGAGDTATATIVDDDSTLSIHSDASVVEGDSGSKVMTFVLDRIGGTAYASEVAWRVVETSNSSGNASAADFNGSLLPSGTLILGAGQSQIELAIPGVIGDRDIEGNETFRLELMPAASPDMGLSIDPERADALGTLIDNDSRVDLLDAKSLIQADVVAEGATLTFTVERTGYLGAVSFIDWSVVSAEGFSNGVGDFGLASGTVKLGIGEIRRTFTVNVNADNVSELHELFRLSLTSASSGTTVGISESYLKVLNEDADRISLTANTPSQAEGDATGYTTYTFTLTRENPLIDCTVDWTVAGSGLHPLDASRIEQTTGTAVFARGELTTMVSVKVSRDDVGDFDRAFTLSLDNPETLDVGGAILVNSTANAVVQNDDPAFAVELVASSNPEGSGTSAELVTFRLVRSGDARGTATVDWKLEGDGPQAATLSDFGGYWPSGRAIFEDGQSVKTLQVALAPDSNFEPDEGFRVVMSNLVTADPHARIIVHSASGVIANDDTGVFVSASSPTTMEGDSAPFTITARGVPNTAVRVYWTLEGTGASPANANDLGNVVGQDGFDATRNAYYLDLLVDDTGNAQKTVTVATVDDRVLGADEVFRLRVLEVTNASVVDGRAAVTILNDDALVAISPPTVVHSEGDSGETIYSFTVTRTGRVSEAATVTYTVSGFGDNPATEDDFLSGWSGVVTFAAGVTSTTLELKVKGDGAFESDESFIVSLAAQSASSSTQIDSSGSKAIGVIENDDSTNLIFKAISAAVKEGTASQNFLTYEILRNGDNSQALEVSFSITGVSIDVFDLSQIQLVETQAGLSGTVTMPAGESRMVLSLPIAPNAVINEDRECTVSISAEGFADPAPVNSTISDDDAGITLSLISSPSAEGHASGEVEFVFNITRNGTHLGATDVMWAIEGLGDNTARGADFLGGELPEGVASFVQGQTQATIVIKLAGDLIVENNEAFRLSLLSSSDSTQRILMPSVDAVIINDDVAGGAADVIQTGSGSDFIEAGAGDDLIEAGDGADMVYAGSGHDTIHAQGGADAIYAGLGDDVIWLIANNVAHFDGVAEQATSFVDGGFGVDTIALDGEGIDLDLIALVRSGQVRSIEKFDLSGAGSNTLEISFEALSTSDADAGADGITELLIDGDANDRVILTDYRDWSRAGDADGYAVWNHIHGTARLVINLELGQSWI